MSKPEVSTSSTKPCSFFTKNKGNIIFKLEIAAKKFLDFSEKIE